MEEWNLFYRSWLLWVIQVNFLKMISTMKKISQLLILTLLIACQPKEENKTTAESTETSSASAHHNVSVSKIFQAHGGYETWLSMNTMSYRFGGVETIVDMQHRYTVNLGEDQQVGFDGQNVWVNPPSDNAEGQRMRYNLMWYFYAFPFVVGDPGVIYEDLDRKVLDGVRYNAIKISYEDGIGDSPKDNYIILSDPKTDQMRWLMYTATFGGEERKTQYTLIKYDGWENREGLLLPTTLQWYNYEGEELKGPRGQARVFEEVKVMKDVTNTSIFAAPEGAYIIEN
jgi:hypothetical protein